MKPHSCECLVGVVGFAGRFRFIKSDAQWVGRGGGRLLVAHESLNEKVFSARKTCVSVEGSSSQLDQTRGRSLKLVMKIFFPRISWVLRGSLQFFASSSVLQHWALFEPPAVHDTSPPALVDSNILPCFISWRQRRLASLKNIQRSDAAGTPEVPP